MRPLYPLGVWLKTVVFLSALTASVDVVFLLGGIAVENLLPTPSSLVLCGVKGGVLWLLLLRFAGAVFSCGGGLAVASFVRVLFCFFFKFCKSSSLFIHTRHAPAVGSSKKNNSHGALEAPLVTFFFPKLSFMSF